LESAVTSSTADFDLTVDAPCNPTREPRTVELLI